MIMPVKADSFSHALRKGTEIFHHLKSILKSRGLSTAVGDEGGFAPTFKGTEDALDTLLQAIEKAGYRPGDDIMLALDCASSELFDAGDRKGYKFWKSNPDKLFSADEMIEIYKKWITTYPIVSIEDPLDQNDWEGYARLTKELGSKIQIVGDDFFVTNTERLQRGIKEKACNSILIKLNQIGTVSQTMQTIRLAQRKGYRCVMSHRSGESEDSFIADFAVAMNTGQIKTGATSRSERNAKYNRLLTIEAELGDKAKYGGKAALLGKIKG